MCGVSLVGCGIRFGVRMSMRYERWEMFEYGSAVSA